MRRAMRRIFGHWLHCSQSEGRAGGYMSRQWIMTHDWSSRNVGAQLAVAPGDLMPSQNKIMSVTLSNASAPITGQFEVRCKRCVGGAVARRACVAMVQQASKGKGFL